MIFNTREFGRQFLYDFALQFKGAMESRKRFAILSCDFWGRNSFFLWDFWRFGSINAEIASDCDCAILVR